MADGPRAVLMAEIEVAIGEYTASESRKPPYSTPELVVMAAVCGNEIEVTEESVLRWTTATFPYYTRAALDDYITNRFTHTQTSYLKKAESCVPGIKAALESYDLPLRTTVLHEVDEFGLTYHRAGVQVLLSPARVFLRSVLEPTRQGTFRFLELPPELRNAVYENLFIFDKHGFTVRYASNIMYLESREFEEYDAKISTDAGNAYTNIQRATAPPLAITLATLCTCKQVYDEAMPYFYRDNRIRFDDLGDFATWINRLAPSRLEQLGNLSLDIHILHDDQYKDVNSALKALTATKRLRRLELSLFDGDHAWMKMSARLRRIMGVTRSRTFTKVEQIPIFSALAVVASRATELVITSDGLPHEEIEKYLRSEAKRLNQVEADNIKNATEKSNGSLKKVLGCSKTGAVKRTKRQEALAARAKTKGQT
ncbi:hypothetical protein LTR97_005115 [Elasticomyces elasticus]|uniref:DUF7730 domain-containing protein n=1 Tax=Elasticomyces elasticus TaxID=574655 RepID=A0AAN7W7V2_9PEZI|nr:hypothetical protein LTR97_005115 [Elasticomyces elasticus]